MSKLRPELYVGREPTYVKHFVLEFYLEKLAYKIGLGWNGATLNYIDSFAGPWRSKDEKFQDTSPHIAVHALRNVRDRIASVSKAPLIVRTMFMEKEEAKYMQLRDSFADVVDVDLAIHHGEFESNVAEARAFGSAGANPFCFTFIDPCGWTGYGLEAITPLLRVQPGEVLINFMFNDINRFIDDPKPANVATFEDLFGSITLRDAWVGLQGDAREERIVSTYCQRIRDAGQFRHVVSAVVINPMRDRTHFHLVYGTRADEGLKTFRDAERSALSEQAGMRAHARQRKREARTGGQGELFSADALTNPYVEELHQERASRACTKLFELLDACRVATFDELAIAAMQHPMVSEQDVRDFLVDQSKHGTVAFDGLTGRERTPQWNQGHRVRLLNRR